MKKKINVKILLLIFIFVLNIVFGTPGQNVKAADNAPVLQASGNIATFIKGQSEVNVDPNITLTGIDNIDGARIYIGQGFDKNEDSLVFTNQNNITGQFDSATGVLTLSGVDTTANYQTALRSIKYINSSSNPSTAQRKIVFSIGEKVLYCPPTKHYYEYVSSTGVRWDTAKTDAESKNYYGLKGYLVTITSEEENDFIKNKIAGNTWIGASDDVQLGKWTWRTGPEAGQCFWDRTPDSQGKIPSDGNYTYNDMYNNWDIGEPNNYQGSGEYYAHMYSYSGNWNDLKIDNPTMSGYVVEYSEINTENPTLQLVAEVTVNVEAPSSSTPTLSASPQNEDNMISLNWNPNDSTQTYKYMVSKRDVNLIETNYQTIPLNETAKVLNVYPGGGTPIAGETDLDGRVMDTSGSAKQWMQNYGNGKITVDSVYIDNFSANPDKYLKDINGNYNYDVVFIGSWDSNNGQDISPNASTAIQAFINAGGGYLAGHDTTDVYDKVNLVTLAENNMNMHCNTAFGLYGGSSGNVNISVAKKGSLTNYPWNLSSNNLSVPASHTTNQFAKGYVWMKYDSSSWGNSPIYSDGSSTGTNNFYLTTWNNTAMIQTGHSNGAATEDEQKILANTLLYLSQVSSETSFDDHTAQDVTAPKAVSNVGINIDSAKKAKIDFDAAIDLGNIYEYQLKAFGDIDKKTYTSNVVQSSVTSGIKGYAIVVDQNPITDPGNSVTTTSDNFTSDALTNGTWYVHIKAIDNAGNASSIVHKSFDVDGISPELTLIPDTTEWTNGNVNVKVEVSDELSGVKEVTYTTNETVPQTGTVSISNGVGTITLNKEGQYDLTVTAKDNSLNEVNQRVNVKIDNTLPTIESVTGNPNDWTSNDVTLTVNASDGASGLAAEAYSFDGGSTWQSENTKTYTENTSNIVVEVKDVAGNIEIYNTIDITKIDKTVPNTPVIENSDRYVDSNWYNDSQTITAKFTTTAGSMERLQYKINTGTWTDGESVTISTEGKNDVSFRVIDTLGRTSSEQTVKVNIDKTAPANAKITVKDREFTSILNKITFGIFFKDTVNVTISADDAMCGINKIEYQKVAEESGYNLNSTWTSGNSFNVEPDDKFVVYGKVTDNAGNYVVVNSDGVVVDGTNPELTLTPDTTEWTNGNVNVKVEVSDKLAGVKEVTYTTNETVPQTGTVSISNGVGTIELNKEGQYYLTVTVKDNSLNEVNQKANVKIDITAPTIEGTGNAPVWTNSDVILTINASDAGSGLNTAGAYSFDNGSTWTTVNSKSFSSNGTVNIKVRDNSGNITSQDVIIDKIDKIAPTIEGVTGNPSDWTSNDVTLTVNASDVASGLEAKAYSFDGGSTWQSGNAKTYTENTSNIMVRVRDVAGNIATYDKIDITMIDKEGPNTSVIENSDRYVDSNWYNNSQTITARFTATVGYTERLQYKVNTGTWTDGESVIISTEGKNDVSFRVIDTLGRTSSEQTVKVNIDKTAPANAKITVKDREFTSILNKITFGIFFKDTVNVTISADDNMSGINKIEYQKVAEESGYNPNGTWTSGNSFNVVPDDKFVVYGKVTDNAGNYVVINSDGVVVDGTNPELTLTPDTTEWTNGNVNVKVEVSDKLAGVKEVTYTTNETVPQTGTVSISNGVGTITLNKEGQYDLTVTAKDNSLNEVNQRVNVKIDRTIPKISGVSQGSTYFIGRVIKVTDSFGEVAEVTYKLDTNNEVSFSNGIFLDKVGKYTLTLKDKAGNSTMLLFEIKQLPKVESIIYTEDCKALIENIRAEFDSHNDLIEPYKSKIDNEIKALEARYSQLHKEVVDIKTETSIIKSKIESLPKGIDGLLNLNKEISEEYNKIDGNTSSLTVEQKLALVKEAEYLKQQLDIIATLQSQIDSIKTSVSNLDTNLDGLISKEDIIKDILGNIYKLTKEQQQILKAEIELLNSLIDKSNTLKKEVEDVKAMISKLPSSEKIAKQDFDLLISIDNLYNKLTNEQKSLVGENLVKHLKECLDFLSKLMLYDEENEITITGIDGTKFDSKVYLVVTPIKEDNTNTKFTTSAERVKNAAKTLSEIKGKELVELYDISLFKDTVKIQPEGKVEVRIKIPENLSGRSGLDIIHIADDGMVTPMHATVENGYLVFITTHFSEYAIVADSIEKTIPKAGDVVGSNILIVVGGLLVLSGLVIITRKRRRV